MPVFCTYCGKEFTRKEHLERHIPHHTNVKPHRCPECYISFARRDLLSRHIATYHTEKELDMGSTTENADANTPKNQIACLPCSQAKTACDKGLPSCSRCREKNLTCYARYARRSTKVAARNAAAKRTMSIPMPMPTPMLPPTPPARPSSTDFGFNIGQRFIQAGTLGSPEVLPGSLNAQVLQSHDLDTGMPAAIPLVGSETHEPQYGSPNIVGNVGDLIDPTYFSDPSDQHWWDFPHFDMLPMSNVDPANLNLSMQFSPVSANSDLVSTSQGGLHTRSDSLTSVADVTFKMESDNSVTRLIQGHDAAVAAESAWPVARCNALIYSGNCPPTASGHLDFLAQKLANHNTWAASSDAFLQISPGCSTDQALVAPVQPRPRDNLLGIFQHFLKKTLDTHREDHRKEIYLLLPPAEILDYLLQIHVRTRYIFYSLMPRNRLDPNEMMNGNETAAILVLLMIAQGASLAPNDEARALSPGLIEICRLSLFDVVEKKVEMCADLMVHRCALLFTLSAVWSGDKWLMDISMGQRGIYLTMLKHAGLFEPSTTALFNLTNLSWNSWVDYETKNRLVYNWVMVDQELSLFHDTAPLLPVSDLCAPLPGPENLWTAGNAGEWTATLQANNTPDGPPVMPSLSRLYQEFVHSHDQPAHLNPHRMRLLLHPLQSLVWHVRSVMLHLSDVSDPTAWASTENTQPIQKQVEVLLQKWHNICHYYFKANATCPVTMTNLALFHLIALNTVVNFPAIEQHARREWQDGPEKLGHHIHAAEQTIYHCGQVIRMLRAIPEDHRPVWWSVALYRAMLTLWAFSILRRDPSFKRNVEQGIQLVIDHVTLEDQPLFDFLWKGKNIAVLSGPDGSTVSLEDPSNILIYAISMLDKGFSSRLDDGIMRKLIQMKQAWYETN
ncbi:hypothetical protein F4802DRAFT_521407 [Xylaria palmicola]|nr:hypothetical protein F4802DRAFT_521407 [Xylaria palmicola]